MKTGNQVVKKYQGGYIEKLILSREIFYYEWIDWNNNFVVEKCNNPVYLFENKNKFKKADKWSRFNENYLLKLIVKCGSDEYWWDVFSKNKIGRFYSGDYYYLYWIGK